MRQQRMCSATLSALAVCSLHWPMLAAAAGDGPSAAAKDGTFTGMVENGYKSRLLRRQEVQVHLDAGVAARVARARGRG